MSDRTASGNAGGAGGARRRLVVLRHGQTGHNAQGIWQGQIDAPLSELGHRQAKAAARALVALAPNRVVASDLSRAADTGREVAAVCGVPVSLDDRFREIHVGDWAGRTAEQVRADYPEDQDRLLRGEDFKRGGHGEAVADVAERAHAAAQDLLTELGEGECAVIATHGVAGRALAASLLGMGQRQAWLTLGSLGNCHWAELTEGHLGWRLQTWNVAPEGVPTV